MASKRVGAALERAVKQAVDRYGKEAERRSLRAGKAMKKVALRVLNRPGPSAPGQPPGKRTGAFRTSWKEKAEVTLLGGGSRIIGARIESGLRVSNGHLLVDYLEDGTDRMAARPHMARIRREAESEVRAIFSEPYGRR